MTNSGLTKALELTWENKAKFYEDTKNLTMMEIVTGIEKKYGKRNRPHRRRAAQAPALYVKASQLAVEAIP
jgi:hypothetical protein